MNCLGTMDEAHATLVAAPFLLAVGFWALTSLVITGQLFEQSSSAYGTTAQISTARFCSGLEPLAPTIVSSR